MIMDEGNSVISRDVLLTLVSFSVGDKENINNLRFRGFAVLASWRKRNKFSWADLKMNVHI